MIYIHEVHMSNGTGHQHIEAVRWRDPNTGEAAENRTIDIVRWIQSGGEAYVCGGGHLARVGVVDRTPPHIRTHSDGWYTDNLLSLPRY